MIRVIFDVTTTSASCNGVAAPVSPVPEPRGTTATLVGRGDPQDPLDLRGVAREGDEPASPSTREASRA